MAKRSKKSRSKTAPAVAVAPLPSPAQSPATPLWQPMVTALVIIAACLWIYAPSLHGGWLWDDDIYVTDNTTLRDLHGLWRIWFEPGATREYYPLDFTAWWIGWHLWGLSTTGYHVTCLACHIASSLLVWRLLAKFRLRFAWLGGLLFAVHPLQVESVAWIAELKDTLSTPPFLLALICWVDFEDRRLRRDYLLALALFLAAMLGKPTMLAFPAVILLYAWWKRGRIDRRDLLASAPFFVVSMAIGAVAVWFTQRTQPLPAAVHLETMSGILPAVIVPGLVLSFALACIALPLGLMPIYPSLQFDAAKPLQLLPWPILAGVIFYAWTRRRTWGPHLLLALGFFLAMMAPVLGFVAKHHITMTWSLDHLDYLPMIGVAGLVALGLGALEPRVPFAFRGLVTALPAVVLVALAWQSRIYAGIYERQDALLRYTMKMNPLAWPANYNLGRSLLQAGKVEPAIEQLQQAIALAPSYAKAHFLLGNAYVQQGRTEEALEQFQQAIDAQPGYADAHYNLGDLLKQTGHLDEAAGQYQEALRLDPALFKADYNLGNILLRAGMIAEAIDHYRAALKLKPDYAEAHDNLANALMKNRQADEAIDEYQLALKDGPDDAGIHYDLGNALYLSGRAAEAIKQFEQALTLNPSLAAAHYNLGYVLMQTGQAPEAIEQFQETLKLHPDDAGARENLEKLQAMPTPK